DPAGGDAAAGARASRDARLPTLMQAYLLRRVAQSILTLIGIAVLVVDSLRVVPGDPAKMLLPEGAPQSAVDELNRQLGLKEPIHVQYAIFLKSVFRGDFG